MSQRILVPPEEPSLPEAVLLPATTKAVEEEAEPEEPELVFADELLTTLFEVTFSLFSRRKSFLETFPSEFSKENLLKD